ncbi:hypothetical protein [Vibrio splendidus]|uniref:hypothetical protein n=1 Tax=Vibrio splendidus TaxID=29497 RepID=UPI00076A1C30|nr:hypothetical protein [Vibrio splendidus]
MEIFNNRELASMTMVTAIFIWSSYKNQNVSWALISVARAFIQKAIIITLITLIFYTSLIILILYHLGVWDVGQLKNTILWFLFVALVQVSRTINTQDPKSFLHVSLSDQVKLIILVQFLVAFQTFGYFTELVLVSSISVLAMCSVISDNNPSYYQAKRLFDILLAVIGASLFIGSFWNIYTDPDEFFSLDTFRDFLVPILLSVGLLPYIYAFYHFLAFERAFARAKVYTECKLLRRYAEIQSFIIFRGNHTLIYRWMQSSCASEFRSKQLIKASILKFKQTAQ